MDIRTRSAVAADVPVLRAVVAAAYGRYRGRMDREPAPLSADWASIVAAGRCTVAVAGGEVLGLVVVRVGPGHLLVENLAVTPAAQGRGVGSLLLAGAEREAVTLGLAEVRLYTNAAMTENLTFYPARGYAETGRRIEEGFARVFFGKRLRPAP